MAQVITDKETIDLVRQYADLHNISPESAIRKAVLDALTLEGDVEVDVDRKTTSE